MRQQMAVESANTVARFKKVEEDMGRSLGQVRESVGGIEQAIHGLERAVLGLQHSVVGLQHTVSDQERTTSGGFAELREAYLAQARAHQNALDQLLDLLTDHTEEEGKKAGEDIAELRRRIENSSRIRHQPPELNAPLI